MYRAVIKCIYPIFFTLCQSSPFTTYNGTTHRTGDAENLIAIWIKFRVKSKFMKGAAEQAFSSTV